MSGKQVELKVRYYLVLDAPPRLWHLVQIVSQSGVIIPPVTPVRFVSEAVGPVSVRSDDQLDRCGTSSPVMLTEAELELIQDLQDQKKPKNRFDEKRWSNSVTIIVCFGRDVITCRHIDAIK